MNFMTSDNIVSGSVIYVPFWILLEYLDISPPDPFIKCTVITIGRKTLHSPNGPVDGIVCDLDLGKDGLIAYSIPLDYVIQRKDLGEWAERISKWFSSFPSTQQ